MHVTMKLSLPRQPSSVTRARQVLTTLLGLTDADEEARGHLAVLISEACANAVRHSDPESTVDLTIDITDSTCRLEISNRGITPDGARFSAGLPDPLTVGGRGLPFMAALADSATFAAEDSGQVVLRIQKDLPGEKLLGAL
ncbi:hypothetical protein GCM10010172_73270 [Paractinoplanes ferrugineus]|uniref:Histidine kinase/HSP90-like ATPase domain-containing protein n=1 Tax=Paractinoplanes ferrugineus TaxID=113564 RepID=A0A919J230_9ACTN|nr:ATP-binding protein [Actinoplanes ferrugineus]GIE11518.1 hypothetical protein Afe05nite_33580 [Actinoplanes ferrugineus]